MNLTDDYSNLISRFLRKEISVQEFEKIYLAKFKGETRDMSEYEFEALDWLFAKVDCYTDIQSLIDQKPEWHINEDQLRESAAKVLEELIGLKKQ